MDALENFRNRYVSIMHNKTSTVLEDVKKHNMTPIEEMAYYELKLFQLSYGWHHLTILPQLTLGKYRIDFVVIVEFPNSDVLKIAIECDGHDFHEKTKAQASKDKERDRELQKKGYKTFRYSGSDIVKNPSVITYDLISIVPVSKQTKEILEGKET
jgi:very-short-patch-repair endonuclease